MIRRATIVGLALVVLGALAWELSMLGTASAQQPGQQQSAASQAARKQATTQPAPATQPAQGRLVVQPGGSAAGSKPTREELKALARAAEEWVKNNPKGKSVAVEKPQVKDNMCPEIPLEEREAIGLPAPTWVARHGKIQPAVLEALDVQRELNERDFLDAQMLQADRPMGFAGTAYVDVYLRHEATGGHASKENKAAIRRAQDRLLSSLTAVDFSVSFAFESTAGLVGYINESGLAKVLEDPDVIAVGVDDQATNEPPLEALSEPLGPGQIKERIEKVDAEVYRALAESSDGRVYVVIQLNLSPAPDIPPDAEVRAARAMQDQVLSSLTAEEFRLACRIPAGGLSGYATGAALAKLNKHACVREVALTMLVTTREWPKVERESTP